jgi:hypothetical protein
MDDGIVRVKAYDGVNDNGMVKECDCLFRLDTNRGMIDFNFFLIFVLLNQQSPNEITEYIIPLRVHSTRSHKW